MAFEDVVAKLIEGPEAIGDVEAFAKTLREEHEAELSVHQTKIESLNGQLQERDQKIVDLKLTNYDLIQGKPAGELVPGNGANGEDAPKQQGGISSLFETKE